MYGLAAREEQDENSERFMNIARGITNTCHESYIRSDTKVLIVSLTGCPIPLWTWVWLALILVFHHLAQVFRHICQIAISPIRIRQAVQ